MKKLIWILVICCLSVNCFAKRNPFQANINSVNKMSGETRGGVASEILTIRSSQAGGKAFDGLMRISMLLVGKNGKTAWGSAERSHVVGEESTRHKGYKRTADMKWIFTGYNGALKRPKLKGYTIEYGYKKGGVFIVLEDDFYRTDSFDDFSKENEDALPLTIESSTLTWVS